MLERSFKKKVISELKELDVFFFVKEALAILGIPDIIMCRKGRFVAWELKRSEEVAGKWRKGFAMQKYILNKINLSGGIGRVVYPENFEECLKELKEL